MPAVHLTARMRPPFALFDAFEHADWFWGRLRAAFPEALATCLMPNHPHLLAVVAKVDRAESEFARICAGFARRVTTRGLWESVPPAKILISPDKLRREVRYVLLNGPRARLVVDPLAYLWSTHRDVMGAVVDPWVEPVRVAKAFRWPRRGFVERFHSYVSGDPSVRVDGTPLPVPVRADRISRQPLEVLAAAACATTRAGSEALTRRTPTRRLFIALALRQGWTKASELAALCEVSTEVVRRIRRAPPPGLAAAALCAGDPRLRAPVDVSSWKTRNLDPGRVDVAARSWPFSNFARGRSGAWPFSNFARGR